MIAADVLLTEQAETVDRVWKLFLLIAAMVGAVVVGLLAYVLLRFRRRNDDLPTPRHEHIPLELTYTAIPLVIVAALFGVTVWSLSDIEADAADPDLTVEVTGFQWQWRFEYPDSGIQEIGDATTVPELVLPAGRTVRFEMTASDVIHSFWVPGFRFKRDVFPGETTTFQVDVTDAVGFYENVGACAEFCGLDHHRMRFSVRILPADEFDEWIATEGAGQ